MTYSTLSVTLTKLWIQRMYNNMQYMVAVTRKARAAVTTYTGWDTRRHNRRLSLTSLLVDVRTVFKTPGKTNSKSICFHYLNLVPSKLEP